MAPRGYKAGWRGPRKGSRVPSGGDGEAVPGKAVLDELDALDGQEWLGNEAVEDLVEKVEEQGVHVAAYCA